MSLNLHLHLQPPRCFFYAPFPSRKLIVTNLCSRPEHIRCLKSSTRFNNQTYENTIERRSANYKPNIWDFNFIQSLSLSSNLEAESYERVSKLKEAVRLIFDGEDMTKVARLELIDNVERLGLGHIFENEIKKALDNIVSVKGHNLAQIKQDEHLHAVALHFRILRKHGYEVSQNVFTRFMKDNMGNFQLNIDIDDVKGMLSLYEASQLALEGETVLEETKNFTSQHLKEIISKENLTPSMMEKQVRRSLAIPLHRRMLRQESRWYIEYIEKEKHLMYPELLELAKLDFNIVQETYRNELRELSTWWDNLSLASELPFARDRLMENFLWNMGIIYEPQYSNCRKELTKLFVMITVIDDVYDVYGTLDELELFTDIVDRWDINAIDHLPSYMKICFLALYNTVNGIAYNILKEKHMDATKYFKKIWGDLCKSYLIEAQWFYGRYTPTIDEYLDNAWVTGGAPVILGHAYFLVKQETTEEGLECIESFTDLIRWSSYVVRLADDLGTSKAEMERGDAPKSVQCLMQENGVSEDIARDHVRHLIIEQWKKINREIVATDNSPFSKTFRQTAVNLARTAQWVYQHGDGHSVQDSEIKNRVSLLLLEPFPLSTTASSSGTDSKLAEITSS